MDDGIVRANRARELDATASGSFGVIARFCCRSGVVWDRMVGRGLGGAESPLPPTCLMVKSVELGVFVVVSMRKGPDEK